MARFNGQLKIGIERARMRGHQRATRQNPVNRLQCAPRAFLRLLRGIQIVSARSIQFPSRKGP